MKAEQTIMCSTACTPGRSVRCGLGMPCRCNRLENRQYSERGWERYSLSFDGGGLVLVMVRRMRRSYWSLQASVLVACLLLGGAAHGTEAQEYMTKAAKAWDDIELEQAAVYYEKALKEGDLYPSDVIVAYVRIGTVQAAKGQKTAALSSFRVAAALDPTFALPDEAGPSAKAVYERARKETIELGGKLTIRMEAPATSRPGEGFVVTAFLPEEYVPLVASVGIMVQDPSVSSDTLRPWIEKKRAAAEVDFDIPDRVVMGGASLLVRVDALDINGNRWTSTQTRVAVSGDAPPEENYAPTPKRGPTSDDKSEAGFWASPWPWIVGSVLLVGIGVGTYFVARPSQTVHVTGPVWCGAQSNCMQGSSGR